MNLRVQIPLGVPDFNSFEYISENRAVEEYDLSITIIANI